MKIFFVEFFCVFLPPLLNIFCFCYVLTISVFIGSIFAWNVPLVSLIFLKRSLVFPILLFSFISLHWMLRKAFLSLLAILWNSEFKWLYLSFSLFFFSWLFVNSHIECSTFTASSFRIWYSSTGIPSPLLALFRVMLPKTYLTSHSRCLVLGEWSHHCCYLGHDDLFCTVLCILATSS